LTGDQDIRFERINVSTELAIREKQRRQQDEGKKKVPTEYHDYLDLFQESEATGLPPHRDGVDLQIHFKPGETGIPDKKLYPLGENELEEIRNYLKQNLKRGWIRESFAEGASPILFVKKKDGKLRLCVDYRGLNEITRKDRHKLPLISEALDRLKGAKYFTKLDIKDAYHNIRIRKGDEWKTTFGTRYGIYEYLVMPFGISNAPAAFQRWINRILKKYLDICCIVYLDDVLVYSKNLMTH
jgi:hypothetical protein